MKQQNNPEKLTEVFGGIHGQRTALRLLKSLMRVPRNSGGIFGLAGALIMMGGGLRTVLRMLRKMHRK